jgi:hypothetical protein
MTSFKVMVRELLIRHQPLTLYGFGMLLIMLPTMVAMGFDDRLIRGVGVWEKPLKFMASTAIFSLSAAWFVGLLPIAQRTSRATYGMAWLLILTSAFEVAYITFQGALGQASHYNTGDLFHSLMFGMMAVAAVGLTASQAWLAWLIARHVARPYSSWALAVIAGLTLTFVLGTASGFMLGAVQPPAGPGLPIVGWHLGSTDARPAHFLGVHAQQLVPLMGFLVTHWQPRAGRATLVAGVAAYCALWTYLVTLALVEIQ